MDGVAPDLGKFVLPGYFNANPPGQPSFALTGSSGLATSIGQAGSEVSVNGIGNIDILSIADLTLTSNNDVPFASATVALINDGSIAITTGTTTGTEPMTLTAQGIITIQSEEIATGGVNITTGGGGAVVNIVNAGEFDFDPLGPGALTGIQTINGSVYPPAGTGAASITQAGALVACLGNGGVFISSIGAGVTADIENAGTITFDTLGPGALVNLSTINGAAYPPVQELMSSIQSPAGSSYVNCYESGINSFTDVYGATNVDISAGGAIGIQSGTGDVLIAATGLAASGGTVKLDYVQSINFDDDPAAGSSVSYLTYLNFIPDIGQISGVSTINGAAYPPAAFIPADLSVSSLTAANYVSTLALNVSSIANVAGALNVYANDIVIQAPNVSVIDPGGAGMTVLGGVTQLVGVSTINGAVYPPIMGSISSISGYGLGNVNIDSATSTITMSANGVNNAITAGADASLTVGAPGLTVALTEISTLAFRSATAGLISNTVELSFTTGGGIGGKITNLSTINGVAWPPPAVGAAYTLSGTTSGAVITTFPTGAGNPLTQNVFTNITRVTFNVPPNWTATDSVFYDGWGFWDFDGNLNSYWGVNYFTNTVATPVDLIGSTTVTANAISISNTQQYYLPWNLIIPPTNLTVGGTITLTFYCNPTSANHYLSATPNTTARIGVALD